MIYDSPPILPSPTTQEPPASSPSYLPRPSTTTASSSLWAAPAPLPETTPEWISSSNVNSYVKSTEASAKPATQTTMTWPNQPIAPANPVIIGHSNHTIEYNPPTLIHFDTPLSPITPHFPHNPNPFMNEIYSFTQQHDLDNTLLLPFNIINPMNETPNL